MSIILVSLLEIDFFQFCGQIIRVVETGLILTCGVSVVTLQTWHSPAYGYSSSEVLNVQIIIVRKTDGPGNNLEDILCPPWENILPDVRKLTEVHRLLQRDQSNVVLDDTQATSNVEPRMFQFQLQSLGGVCPRLVLIRYVMFAFLSIKYKSYFLRLK